ncbi:hypothetical protein BN132_1497 [Cronobacter turicensis 564]|nr:hypothetical protein BN132_1497 [Cronobacter turicensis 564]
MIPSRFFYVALAGLILIADRVGKALFTQREKPGAILP